MIAGGRIDEIEPNQNHIHITSSKELEWAIEARALDGAVVADLHHDHSAEWERLFAKAALAGIPVYHFRQILDELPQAWNILKGEMSWIGPRPEAIQLSEWYENELPFYSYRHIVRPGITGWAQVNQGHVTDLDSVTDKLRYDFYYVKNISHWLDMLITLKTVRVVLGGFGAR